MAIPINLDDLVNLRTVESTRVEFKTGFNPNPIIHTICAFANDIDNIGGGYIVIGIEERDGMPVLPPKGIEQSEVDGILKRLVGMCRTIEPLYNPIVEPVEFQGAYLIVIWVPAGFGRPYKAPRDVLAKNAVDKRYYIRKFSSTLVASPQEERELFYVSSDIPFDDRPNLLATIDDLDLGIMREHVRAVGSALGERPAISVEELADDLQLLSGPPENRHPRNVGILMFCEHPERYFRYARIEVVDMPDPTGDGMTEMVFTGPIQRQLRDALGYLESYVIKRKTFKEAHRAESDVVYNYPMKAVEEILSNAVYHRSYQVNEPITVRVTPASLEVTSFPGFDRSITDEDIRQHRFRARVYRNRRIGDFLKELRLVEGRNTGYPAVFAALAANGSPEPAFEMDEARGFLSVTLPVHPAFIRNDAAQKRAEAYEQKLVDTLARAEGPLSMTELAHALGYKGITKRLSDTVEAMVSSGRLERVTVAGQSRSKLQVSRSR